MRGRSVLLIIALAIGGTLVTATPVGAQPLDKGRYHETFTDTFDCDGTPARVDEDFWVNFTFNLRGSSPFPYYRENAHGTSVTTNLNTGGTYTNAFSANSQDHVITDNGDGTITIVTIATGGSRFYDTNGKLVLRDPGQVRFSIDIDYNGTPADPDDDIEVPDSFHVVRESTGRNDAAGRDFCADLVEFTS